MTDSNRQVVLPMIILGTLFFIFGFITWLNGALIPYLQIICELSETQALLVAFSFYIAYTVMAAPMSRVIEVTGYRMAMVLGLVLVGVGSLGFVPAALTREFGLFIVAQFIVGSGLTLLQTASNPYIVRIGNEQSAAARISVMGILNKGAGVLAPLFFTWLVLGDFSHVSASSMEASSDIEREKQISVLAQSLVYPYVGMAILLVLLAVLLRFSGLPDLALEEATGQESFKSLMAFPHLVLGAITLFCYVGVEVIAGDTIGLYGSKLGLSNAFSLTSYTMAFMVLGYLVGVLCIPRLITQVFALKCSAIMGIAISVALVFASEQSHSISYVLWGWSTLQTVPDPIALLALLGLANALVWPAVWPLALEGLGRYTAKGSALLIMGISGGAIIPMIFGLLSETIGTQQAYWILLPCYLCILYYSISGHRKHVWSPTRQ